MKTYSVKPVKQKVESHDFSLGKFQNGKSKWRLSRRSLSGRLIFSSLVILLLVVRGSWLLAISSDVTGGVIHLTAAILNLTILAVTKVGASFILQGVRVAAGRLEICYTYRSSLIECEFSETRRISWSYVAGVEVKLNTSWNTWEILLRFANPIPYELGEIPSLRFIRIASEALAQSVADAILETKKQRTMALLRVLDVTYSENVNPLGAIRVQESNVNKIFGGPFDVVGDVRGEANALKKLLKVLGYSEIGEHPAGRKLIFVGNLCGQVPASFDVILIVKKMMEAGNAFSIIGKNELHLICKSAKPGKGWFYGDDPQWEQFNDRLGVEQCKEVANFISSLPLIIECEGLYIVDTVWRESCIEEILAASGITYIDLNKNFELKFNESLKREGIEFEQIDSFRHHWRLNNVTSFDYSVGRRMVDLHDELPASQVSMLAALRWPEQTIVFENGEQAKLKFEFLSNEKTQALRTRAKEIQVEFQRPGSTMNIQQAIEALLRECGYLFGKFEDSSLAEIELATSNIQKFLSKDYRSRANYRDSLWREMMKVRRKREYRKLRGTLGKEEFENLSPEVQLQWISHVKEIYPRAVISKSYYYIAERLYERSSTELPTKSWLRKFMGIFR